MINNIQQVIRPVRKYTPFYNGFYSCNDKKFSTRYEAVLEHLQSKKKVSWEYYGHIFRAIPPREDFEISLPELYKARAIQLRENYDYVCLRFSGGIDSTQALHAFIDNNIFIDEIQIGTSKRYERHMNVKDTSATNGLSETKYSAKARLIKYKDKIDPRTFVNFVDIHDKCEEILQNKYWWETLTPTSQPTIHQLSRLASPITNKLRNILDQNKRACIIVGVDKPLVRLHNGEFYGFFNDGGVRHAMFMEDKLSRDYSSIATTEPFFWTPDMPEIVWKQWQEVKKAALKWKPLLEACSQMEGIHAEELRGLLNTTVYQEHVFPYWQSGKKGGKQSSKFGSDGLPDYVRPIDLPVWDSINKTSKTNYLDGINHWAEKAVDPGVNSLDFWESELFGTIHVGYYLI